MMHTLKPNETQSNALERHIDTMATEVARLWQRTQQGLPALTEAEEQAYFSIVQQIAQKIQGIDFDSIHFKVKHSSTGIMNLNVFNADGSIQSIELDIGSVTLPYSLEKPAHGECIFSFGGSRGIIAPFESLDAIYGPKARFFTNARLLGVGQYGSVKEVENLLTGLNQVLKKGYISDSEQSTFTESSRIALRTRPITSRNDPLYRIECDLLHNLSQVEQESSGTRTGSTHFWLEQDKDRPLDERLFAQKNPGHYKIIMDRAKGDTFADTANRKLNQYTKSDKRYHNPLLRDNNPQATEHELDDFLALSHSILEESERFTRLGFTHNDIKPENFLHKRNPDGSYSVKFIDWATGGFRRIYKGQEDSLETLFKNLFGSDLEGTAQGTSYSDVKGRFVERDTSGIIYFGIKPTLQIVHGARNCTLPYISPKVLDKIPMQSNSELDT
ncbi:MAG: hypothetical protein ACHP6H_06795, partial [Legionellales bacterium]